MKPEEIKEFRGKILNLTLKELKDQNIVTYLWDLRTTLEELFNISQVIRKAEKDSKKNLNS